MAWAVYTSDLEQTGQHCPSIYWTKCRGHGNTGHALLMHSRWPALQVHWLHGSNTSGLVSPSLKNWSALEQPLHVGQHWPSVGGAGFGHMSVAHCTLVLVTTPEKHCFILHLSPSIWPLFSSDPHGLHSLVQVSVELLFLWTKWQCFNFFKHWFNEFAHLWSVYFACKDPHCLAPWWGWCGWRSWRRWWTSWPPWLLGRPVSDGGGDILFYNQTLSREKNHWVNKERQNFLLTYFDNFSSNNFNFSL